MTHALLIVDVQKDFCPGGSLATQKGDEVAAGIAEMLTHPSQTEHYSAIVATQDWHIDPAGHFSEEPDYLDSWPVHCRAETHGAEMHEALGCPAATEKIDEYFRKGHYTAAYSGFEGFAVNEDETELHPWLAQRGITHIDIVGIASDHCVFETAKDGLNNGYAVTVLEHLCSPVNDHRAQAAFQELVSLGATVKS